MLAVSDLSAERDNTALGYVTGAFVFALGAAMVAVHNLWTGPLAIVVSLVGWGALIAMRALEPPRDDEQRRLHIEMMLLSELARVGRETVTARVTA